LLILGQKARQLQSLFLSLTLAAVAISWLSLLGYAYGVASLYSLASSTPMALNTSMSFIVLCVGILLARPDWGLTRIVTSSSVGGFIARRLLLAAIAIPSVLGWLIIQGYRLGIYHSAFGLSLLVMASIILFAAWILQNAQILDRIDSERVQAEQSLRDSEERYRAFIEQSAEGIWRFELEQPVSTNCSEDEQIQLFYQYAYLAECNNVMAQMYGFSCVQEIVGTRLPDLLVPSDSHNIEYLRQFIRSSYRLNDAESHEVDKRGVAKYFLNNLVGIIENGLLVRAWGSQRDITDRKEAEQALQETNQTLQALIQASPLAIIRLDRVGNLQMWSPAAARIFGWTEQEVLGHPLPFIPQDKQEEFRQLHQVKLQGNAIAGVEVRRQKQDGSPIDIAIWGAPLYDTQGNINSTMAVIADISDRKRAEEERTQLLARERAALAESEAARSTAQAANRMKDEFLAILSHELRTPLNAMLGWTQILRTRKLDAATQDRAFETIERNTKTLATLIEDILDVSGIIQGKLHLNLSSVELVGVIEAAIDTVRPAAQAKEIELESILDRSLEPILGDANRLQQVVWNLLSNSVKFTPNGGRVEVRLEASTQAEPHSSSYVKISVSDTGKGIAPDFLPYVFDRFRQADSTTTRSQGGLGLGLAIVRHLVELHGGTVYATSPGEGQGATFSVQLPLPVSSEQ
jgi:PAS domain S-box-containing protein